jgi:glycosyltransferase involved in cell wall biosynthesis
MKQMYSVKISPLFSILIANYNNGLYLEKCLHSIFSQTYENWEIILFDDGSTDNSLDIYQKYENHSQIKIIKLFPNKGCGFAKRKCVEAASGEICGFVDADDALAPDALNILVKQHLDNPNHSIVYSTHYNCSNELVPLNIAEQVGPIPYGQFSWMNKRPVISHFATFKRKNYRQTEGITPWLQKAVDKDLYYKLEETGPTLFVNQPLYFYRHHQKSISLNKNSNIAYQYHLAIKALIIIRSSNRAHTSEKMPHSKSELVGGLLQTALHLFKNSNYLNGFTLFFKALQFFPAHVLLFTIKNTYQKFLRHFLGKTRQKIVEFIKPILRTLFKLDFNDKHKNDELGFNDDERIIEPDNDAMINVLISTIDERINAIPAILFEKQPNVKYIISHQYTDPKYKYLPEFLNRDDVVLTQVYGRGLSRNRNNALRMVESGIALIADDDSYYLQDSFENIRAVFQENPHTDVACFKIQTYEGEPEYKGYPEEEYSLNLERRHYLSSLEVAFRIKKIKDNKINFDERFGAGSEKIPAGEEEAFVQDCIEKKLRVNYYPFYIVRHPYESSTKQWPIFNKTRIWITIALEARKSVPKAIGLSLFMTIRLTLKDRANPFFYVFECFSAIWYIFKTNNQGAHN